MPYTEEDPEFFSDDLYEWDDFGFPPYSYDDLEEDFEEDYYEEEDYYDFPENWEDECDKY